METRKRALGRGLEQLFNTENLDLTLDAVEQEIYDMTPKEEIKELAIDEIRPNPYQPRKVFEEDALKELASSIKEHGVFQPIIAKRSIKGYELVAGERRWRASKLAGLTTIPAIVRDFTDEQMMEIGLLENLQRENLSAMEEAEAYQTLMLNLSLTQEELARRVGKSRSHVTNILGLLRLPEEVKQMVNHAELSMGHARVLSKLEDEETIKEMATRIVSEKLSVREIEDIASSEPLARKVKQPHREQRNEYREVDELLREKLDAKVKIRDKKIEISFTNTADLNRILEIIDVKE